MIKIVGAIGCAAVFVCCDTAFGENLIIYSLAEITGAYISQARACDDEWKLVFRESMQYVEKCEPKSELKYMQFVVQSSKRHEVTVCNRKRLTLYIEEVRASLAKGCKPERPNSNS
jgi:predicted DNA-binding protein (UPF0278 family)